MARCPHCDFIAQLFENDEITSNREYWIMTELFVYLHDGKDYCNYAQQHNNSKKGVSIMKKLFRKMLQAMFLKPLANFASWLLDLLEEAYKQGEEIDKAFEKDLAKARETIKGYLEKMKKAGQ